MPATIETGTAYSSRASGIIPGFLLVVSFFLLAIVYSVLLRITESDYPSGIFKLLLLLFGTNDCCQNVLFIFFRHFVIHHDCEDDKPFHTIKLSCVRENRCDNQEWTIQG
jgi:hypothetical protein